MTTITTRAGKGSALTNTEVDTNFTNLDTAKLELGQAQSSGTANAVVYLNASKQPATSSSVTFDGSTFAITGALQTTSGAANYVQVTGAAANVRPVLSAQGSDTNVGFVVQSKGTGAIDLAAGSSGVNISNGTTVTAITRTAAGSGYTSIPTVTISAPTTTGGVQATATASMLIGTVAVASGGSGYTLNDVLTASGGTGTAVTVTVTAVSGGVVTGVTYAGGGSYTVLPSSPTPTTGGTGTNCTLTITYTVGTSFTITQAGSGYVEQPTVTFSGGGGSGAAAYATVGSPTIIRSLGQNNPQSISFYTPSGEAVRIDDNGATVNNYIGLQGRSVNLAPIISGQGVDTNVSLTYRTKGTGAHQFATNTSSGNVQFLVANTASAVNYVQVTGGASGVAPSISAAGSGSVLNLALAAKSTGYVAVTAGTGLGYGTGTGGAVTQTTSRTTGVTLNFPTGAITLVSAAGSTSWQTFTVTNSAVAATDTIIVNQKSGTDLYEIHVTAVAAGSFNLSYRTTAGTTTEQPVFNFAVLKGVTA